MRRPLHELERREAALKRDVQQLESERAPKARARKDRWASSDEDDEAEADSWDNAKQPWEYQEKNVRHKRGGGGKKSKGGGKKKKKGGKKGKKKKK